MTCVQGKFALVLRDLIFVVGTQQGGWWSHYFAVDKLGPRPITFSQSHLLLRSMNSNGVSELGFHLIQLSLGRWCASLSWTLQIFWKAQNHGQVESRVVGLGHTSLNGNDPRRPREILVWRRDNTRNNTTFKDIGWPPDSINCDPYIMALMTQ